MTKTPTKAYVLPVAGREADIAKLRKFIEAGGCALVCPNEPIEAYERCVAEADVVAILVCPETIDDILSGPVVQLAKRLGKRVVAVWAADAEPNKLPTSLHRHADANVRLDAKELAASVCSGEPIWVTSEGEPRPKQKVPRYKGH